MHITEFRIGQRITHSDWPGCELRVTAVIGTTVSAQVIHPGQHHSGNANRLERYTDGEDAKFAMLSCMTLLPYPAPIRLPEGI